ncbi:hypothetical protein GCM10027053_39740 [Intrasporangium mesophilum]
MRQRARGHDPLLGIGDRSRLSGADPDREIATTVALAQQHDRLVGRHLDPDAKDIDLSHVSTVPRVLGRRDALNGRAPP